MVLLHALERRWSSRSTFNSEIGIRIEDRKDSFNVSVVIVYGSTPSVFCGALYNGMSFSRTRLEFVVVFTV